MKNLEERIREDVEFDSGSHRGGQIVVVVGGHVRAGLESERPVRVQALDDRTAPGIAARDVGVRKGFSVVILGSCVID